MQMYLFNVLALLTFTILVFNASTAIAQTTKRPDDGSTGACIKECKSENDCTCRAIPSRYRSLVERFCDIPEGETTGLCSYCIKEGDICSPTTSTANQTFACCDEVGRKYRRNKELVEGVACRAGRTNSKCVTSCRGASHSCVDKDGYRAEGKYINCKGSYDNSVVHCSGKECSITGGACGDGIHTCCDNIYNDYGYTCVNGKCERNCADKGSTCSALKSCCIVGNGSPLNNKLSCIRKPLGFASAFKCYSS